MRDLCSHPNAAWKVLYTPLSLVAACALSLLLAACGTSSTTPEAPVPPPVEGKPYARLPAPQQASDAVIFALGLIDTGYRFGGSNPEAGLDCSGMIAYVMENVSGLKLPHNAAQIARIARPVPRDALRPGDLVFFNTLNRPFSHVGLYVGEGRFVHAPSSRGKVRLESLDNRYFAQRFEGARTLID